MAELVTRWRTMWIGIVILAMAGPLPAQSIRTVPTPHWSYRIADALILRHPELGEAAWIASRPWRESEFRALVDRAVELDLGSDELRVAAWIEMLESEYPALESRRDELALDLYNAVTISYDGAFREDDVTFDPAFEEVRFDVSDGEPENRVVGRHDAALGYRDRIALVWSYVADQNVRNDPTRSRLADSFRDRGDKDEFGMVVLDAYGALELGPVYARIGRSTMSMGPGRGSSVFLSDSIAPLDQVRVEVDVLDPVRFTGIVGRLSGDARNRALDDEGRVVPGSDPAGGFREQVERNVYLHRLDGRWGPWLQAALSEAVVSTAFDQEIETEFASMVVPYGFFDDDDRRSFLWDAEVVLSPLAGLQLYGNAVLQRGEEIDDREAWRVGGTWAPPLRGAGATVGAEYTRTDPRMYVDPGLNTGWTTFDVPLGSMLGPDADQAYGWIEYWAAPTLRLTADVLRRRRGARSLDDPGDFTGVEEDFPSGTVERQWRTGLEGWWISPWLGLEGRARFDHRTVENLENEVDRDEEFWEFRVGLAWRWDSRVR